MGLWSKCSGVERWASGFFVKEWSGWIHGPGYSGRAWVGCLGVYGFYEGVKPLYAGAVYCMEYIVTATNYLIHHLSFQLFL